MSGPLLSTLILSMALHAGLIFFGPDIRPPNFEEFKDNSVEVAMLRREVPLPDALRSKPLPEVPRPNPLNLKRFQESQGNTSELLSPRLRILPPVPTPKNILNAPALSGPPKLKGTGINNRQFCQNWLQTCFKTISVVLANIFS